MDKEQQVRINFLDEAEDCFDTIESILLGLSTRVAETQHLDLALRAAHSVKGGAGMMGFTCLSDVAHRLEDFFKILRVRYHSTQISTDVEILLLQGVDSMRHVSVLHRQGTEIKDYWLIEHINSIFEQLRQHLGDLDDEDEDKLFAQNEDSDPALLMFEEAVETILDKFENQLVKLSQTELAEALVTTSEKLKAFGQLANLEPFIQLCESIQHQVLLIGAEQLDSLTQQALNLWRRSHALVQRGSIEKLPSQLDDFAGLDRVDGVSSAEMMNLELESDELDELSLFDNLMALELLQDDELANFVTSTEAEFNVLNSQELGEATELAQLQEAFAGEISAVELEATVMAACEPIAKIVPNPALQPHQILQQTEKTIRVSAEQFYQFNTLFSKLILERNRINLRLKQLKNFADLMRQRMNQLEQSNTQLRTWYDRSSLEWMPMREQPLPNFSATNPLIAKTNTELVSHSSQGQFDSLEMDRYSDLHLISQAQIETIVQLQEVSADIELGLQEIGQAIQELNQTTSSLQGNVTRTQMVRFADVVKSFPRLVRDLSLRFGKQVNLKIEGETTLLDRAIVETINAPLMHLIRNAFDHGIETPDTRIACGKLPEGIISLQAVNRGTQTIITVQDDGKGICLDKICTRLREMGISDEQLQQMPKSEILNYIFQPGFSTTDRVTELSGRGVGMDVVRTNLQDIRGDIRVNTQASRGTTFTLTIPFTLSILRVMLVERAGIVFAVPVDSVREVFMLARESASVQNLKQLTWQEQSITLVRLEEMLRFNRPHKHFEVSDTPVIDKPTALIVGAGTCIGGLLIDCYWGEQEVSIRPLESPFPLPVGFIGSIILGDGRVLPLVDPVQILEKYLEPSQTQDLANLTVISKDKTNVASDKANTILVVDDSINVRRYLTLTLEKAGYQVEQAKDGREAVDRLFSGMSVQAVICDIEMPRLDGYGVLEEIKAKPEFQSLPIAMLTSRSNEKHRKLAMNLGASAYFSKPYNEQELLQKMAELIGNFSAKL